MATVYFKLCVTLLIFCCSAYELKEFVQFRQAKMAQENQAFLTKTFLKFYFGFSLMFHLENETLSRTNHLLELVHYEATEVVLINLDTFGSFNFQLLTHSPLLHVVLLKNPKKYIKFLKLRECLKSKDVIIFVNTGDDNWGQEEFWNMPKLDWAGNVVILNPTNTAMSLFNVCYYCGNSTGQLNHLQNSSSKIVVPGSELLPHNFTDFRKHRFQIGYVNSFPHMWCERFIYKNENENVYKQCRQANGLEMGILDLLSETLNFTYSLTEYNYSRYKPDTDINKVGLIKLDFIIGAITITINNAPKMSFTSALAFESYTFLYMPQKWLWSEFCDNLKPFQGTVWIIVFLALFWFSICLYICIKATSKGIPGDYFPLAKCFKICFKAIIEQTDSVSPTSLAAGFSPFMVLTLWWLISIIIVTAYKSKLWAISIKNYQIEPSDLRQLLANGYEIVVNSENRDIIEDVLNETDPIIQEANRKLVILNSTCGTLSYALHNKAAMLDEYGRIQNHALILCTKLLDKNIYSKLRITKKSLRQATHFWPLQKGAPYKHAFNILIGRIDAAGLKSKWKSDSLSVLKNNYDPIPFSQSTAEKSEEREFLQGFISSFGFYIIGNIIALCCFVAETIYIKLVDRKQ